MNRVLARQLRRLGLDPHEPPRDAAAWTALLDRVGAHYDGADRSRYLLERAMEISSREMQELTDHIRELARREMERQQQLSQHNFNELPVPAWLEDFGAVEQRFKDLRASGVDDLGRYLDDNHEALRDLVGRVVVLDCNPAVTELVGAERDELVGTVDPSMLSADSLQSWRRQFEAMWNGDGKVVVEFTGQRSDGTPFSAILHWSVAVIDGAHDYSRVMVVIIDITERIEAEERMRDLVLAKDEFLASVSHELRTPLTSVLGYAEVLLADDLDPAERTEMLAMVVDQAGDLSNLVDDLLAGARAEVGQLTVESVPVELSDVVTGCLRSFPGVELDGDDLAGIEALGDAGRVRQILRNLLTNAERYGGDEIRLISTVAEESVYLVVADSGPEIAAGRDGRVFERYYRERGVSQANGSVGIGLTIARELARMMGGELSYRHRDGWSEFVLSLPRRTRLRAAG